MAKVTSKLQVTIPKVIADRFGIAPGDHLRFEEAGQAIRVLPPSFAASAEPADVETRLALFDAATERQRQRDEAHASESAQDRGWTRDELYVRGGRAAD